MDRGWALELAMKPFPGFFGFWGFSDLPSHMGGSQSKNKHNKPKMVENGAAIQKLMLLKIAKMLCYARLFQSC